MVEAIGDGHHDRQGRHRRAGRRRRGQRRQQRADGRRRRRRGDPARRWARPSAPPARRSSTASARCRPDRRRPPTAGAMPARWVIHVVGPVHSRSEDRTDLLASCYREALRVADELGVGLDRLPGRLGRDLRMAARPTPPTSPSAPSGRRRPRSPTCASCCSVTRCWRSSAAPQPSLDGPHEAGDLRVPALRARHRVLLAGGAAHAGDRRRARLGVGEDPELLGPDGVDDRGRDVATAGSRSRRRRGGGRTPSSRPRRRRARAGRRGARSTGCSSGRCARTRGTGRRRRWASRRSAARGTGPR